MMSGPLVCATLEGAKLEYARAYPAKTQTRRPIKRENKPDPGCEWAECLCREIDPSDTPCCTCAARFPGLAVAGDRLWVRETFAIVHPCRDAETGMIDDIMTPRDIPKESADGFWVPWYRANWKGDDGDDRGFRWLPSIHMPRWASRIVLPLVKVRVERVQDITEEDAKAEGLRRTENGWTDGANGYDATSARMAFRELWESIYGEASWDENPWVWVAEWKEIEVSK